MSCSEDDDEDNGKEKNSPLSAGPDAELGRISSDLLSQVDLLIGSGTLNTINTLN